jgi:hypothetical protein
MENQAKKDKLIEETCKKENLKESLRRVKANAGAVGAEGITVKELPCFVECFCDMIVEEVLCQFSIRPRAPHGYSGVPHLNLGPRRGGKGE